VFHGKVTQRGLLRSGEPLLRVAEAKSVRVRGRPNAVGMVVVAEDPAGTVAVDDHRQRPAGAVRAQDAHRHPAGRAAGHGGVLDIDG